MMGDPRTENDMGTGRTTVASIDVGAALTFLAVVAAAIGIAAQLVSYEAGSRYLFVYGVRSELAGLSPFNAAWKMRDTASRLLVDAFPWFLLLTFITAVIVVVRASLAVAEHKKAHERLSKIAGTSEQGDRNRTRARRYTAALHAPFLLWRELKTTRRRRTVLVVMLIMSPVALGQALTTYSDIGFAAQVAAQSDILNIGHESKLQSAISSDLAPLSAVAQWKENADLPVILMEKENGARTQPVLLVASHDGKYVLCLPEYSVTVIIPSADVILTSKVPYSRGGR